MRVDDALGVARRAGREEQRRHVAGLAGRHLAGEHIGRRRATLFDERVQRRQARLVVVAQATRVVEPDVRQLRALLAQLQHLVDLLLVLHHRERDLGVVDREDELRGYRVLVQRHRHGAQRLRGQHAGVQPRPVFADDDEMLAALQTRRGQPLRQLLHQRRELCPGQRLPDAKGLFAQRRRVGPAGRVVEQEPRKGRQACLQREGSGPRL